MQGVVYVVGGDTCWQEVIDGINMADYEVSKQLKEMEMRGVNMEE